MRYLARDAAVDRFAARHGCLPPGASHFLQLLVALRVHTSVLKFISIPRTQGIDAGIGNLIHILEGRVGHD